MQADVFGVEERKPGAARQAAQNLRDRGQFRTGEDVLLDPVAAFAVDGKLLIVDGDGLQNHGAVGFQQTIAGAEVRVIKPQPNRFEHFDADDLVELAAQVAIVLQQQV